MVSLWIFEIGSEFQYACVLLILNFTVIFGIGEDLQFFAQLLMQRVLLVLASYACLVTAYPSGCSGVS